MNTVRGGAAGTGRGITSATGASTAVSGAGNSTLVLGTTGQGSAIASSGRSAGLANHDAITAMLENLVKRYYPEIAARDDAVPRSGIILGFVLAGRDSVIATTMKPLDGRLTLSQPGIMRELFPSRLDVPETGGLTKYFRPNGSPSDRRVMIAWSSLTPL
jgi:hypothetical protein